MINQPPDTFQARCICSELENQETNYYSHSIINFHLEYNMATTHHRMTRESKSSLQSKPLPLASMEL